MNFDETSVVISRSMGLIIFCSLCYKNIYGRRTVLLIALSTGARVSRSPQGFSAGSPRPRVFTRDSCAPAFRYIEELQIQSYRTTAKANCFISLMKLENILTSPRFLSIVSVPNLDFVSGFHRVQSWGSFVFNVESFRFQTPKHGRRNCSGKQDWKKTKY